MCRALCGSRDVMLEHTPPHLKDYNEGKTIVMITHEFEIAQFAKRMIFLRDGRILTDKRIEKRNTKERALRELEKPVAFENDGP